MVKAINLDDPDTDVDSLPSDLDPEIAAIYRNYALLKAASARCRLAGNIKIAQFWERKMEEVYRSLPQEAKW